MIQKEKIHLSVDKAVPVGISAPTGSLRFVIRCSDTGYQSALYVG